jgi:hypothetical protein
MATLAAFADLFEVGRDGIRLAGFDCTHEINYALLRGVCRLDEFIALAPYLFLRPGFAEIRIFRKQSGYIARQCF